MVKPSIHHSQSTQKGQGDIRLPKIPSMDSVSSAHFFVSPLCISYNLSVIAPVFLQWNLRQCYVFIRDKNTVCQLTKEGYHYD